MSEISASVHKDVQVQILPRSKVIFTQQNKFLFLTHHLPLNVLNITQSQVFRL